MKKNNLLLSFVALGTVFSFSFAKAEDATKDTSDPSVVATVDLQKYAGVWYDIAHAPNFFQRKCIRSKAEYKMLTADSISVYNSCVKANGKTADISGVAKIVDPAVPAKLKVRFSFFQRGDYWIVDLDEGYQWAVVSAPHKKDLFILSRSAPMDPGLLQQIIANLKAKGFAVDDLVYDHY